MSSLSAEIIVFKNCTSEDYEFEKNEYKIDIDKGVMIREFVYTDDTYKRLRMNDMRIKKENSSTKGVARENGEIITEISGYPAFYTQMIFNKKDYSIKIKTVLNNTEGLSLIAKCDNIINYKKES